MEQPWREHLEEQLRRRESEAVELRGRLRELGTKFFQLERAFEINLQLQARQEVELNRAKADRQELRMFNNETLRAKMELNSKLMSATIEKDHWKNAFLQQKELVNSNKTEYSNAMMQVKRECEDILKMSRENAEKQFQEVVELYNGAREKVTRLEEEIETYRASQREYENRTLELANLLETLKRFDVNVTSVCQLAAEASKNLIERGNLYEDSMKNLRHLAWATKDRTDEPELVLLREQNSVLRELVKSLKRKGPRVLFRDEMLAHYPQAKTTEGKGESPARLTQTLPKSSGLSGSEYIAALQQTHNEIPKRENEQYHEVTSHETEANLQNCNGDLSIQPTFDGNCAPTAENPINSLIPENNDRHPQDYSIKTREHDECKTREVTVARENDNRKREFDIESRTIDKCGRMLCIESHMNGALYEEYILRLSIDREIKIKYPVSLNNDEMAVKIEFVDDESEYEMTPSDRLSVFLKNIYAYVNVKQTGVSCGTQTTKTKTSNNFVQTAVTGINSFSRLNVGVTMLNSEKRAIERSLYNLERTVKTLKFNALNQAQTMVGKDSRFLGNSEIFDCIKILTR